MGEFESNTKYAKSVGVDIRKPHFDRRTTSQRVTDEMNALCAENAKLKEAVAWYFECALFAAYYHNSINWESGYIKFRLIAYGELLYTERKAETDLRKLIKD